MGIGYGGPGEDKLARVVTFLSFEAGACVLNFFITGIQNWGGQTTYHLTAVQVPEEKIKNITEHLINFMKKIFNVPIAQADFVHISPAVLTNFQKKSCIKANYKQGLT